MLYLCTTIDQVGIVLNKNNMKSKVTLELDFDDKEPFISILQIASDDVRDRLIKHFTECLGFKKEVVFTVDILQMLTEDKAKQFRLKIKQ